MGKETVATALSTIVPLIAFAFAAPARAQCAWQLRNDGGNLPCVHGTVKVATRYDRDGSGPAPEVMVVAGDVSINTSPQTTGLAQYDPATGAWGKFADSTFGGRVNAVVAMANGDLVAAGQFTHVTTPTGTGATGTVARWNGTTWQPVGTAFLGGSPVNLAVAMPNGDLVVALDLVIRRWDGTNWTSLPWIGVAGRVAALAALPDGTLAAAWLDTSARRVTIATWNGVTWTTILSASGSVFHGFAALPNGNLVAVAPISFQSTSNIAVWDGVAWLPIYGGSSYPSSAFSTCVLASGALVVGTSSGTDSVFHWNGTAWSILGSRTLGGRVDAIVELANGELITCETLEGSIGYASVVERWNGTIWTRIAGGTDGFVRALLPLPDGALVAGGSFTHIGGVEAQGIGRWDGNAWSPIGSAAIAIAVLAHGPNGDLVAGGTFASSTGTYTFDIQRWDGTSWQPLGQFPRISSLTLARALAVLPNGDVMASVWDNTSAPFGTPRLLLWNGAFWSQIGVTGSPFGGAISCLAVMANGDLIASGGFTSIGGVPATDIARWDGQSWSAMGQGVTGVRCLLPLANGDLVVGGTFGLAGTAPASGVAYWNGSTWSPMSNRSLSSVACMVELPNGDLLASGNFSFSDPLGRLADGIARWNGTDWFATGIVPLRDSGGFSALAMTSQGEIALAGFPVQGTAISDFFGFVVSPCPATATAVGIGCPSSGGTNTLRAEMLPWIGSELAVSATGLPPLAFVAAGIGATPIAPGALPLANLFPLAGPGCDLLVAPDLLAILVAHGSARATLRLPDTQALVGVSLHAQMTMLELDATGAPLAITSTNAVQLTIGRL